MGGRVCEGTAPDSAWMPEPGVGQTMKEAAWTRGGNLGKPTRVAGPGARFTETQAEWSVHGPQGAAAGRLPGYLGGASPEGDGMGARLSIELVLIGFSILSV